MGAVEEKRARVMGISTLTEILNSILTENLSSISERSITPIRVIQIHKYHKFKNLSNANGPTFLLSSDNFS